MHAKAAGDFLSADYADSRRLFLGGYLAQGGFFYPQITQILADYFWVAIWRRGAFFIRRLRRFSQIIFWGGLFGVG
jgi:hypothetical protein